MRNRIHSAVAPPTARPPNTRDKLRGARSRANVHGGSPAAVLAVYHAPPRYQPPLVSFIALFGSLANCPSVRGSAAQHCLAFTMVR
jgi:hypothetical protein